MDAEIDTESTGTGDGWGFLIIVAILFSAVVHVGLMMGLSDRPFAPPLPDAVKSDRLKMHEMQVMQMQKMMAPSVM